MEKFEIELFFLLTVDALFCLLERFVFVLRLLELP